MIRLIARIRSAIHWMKAVDHSSRGQYEEALRYVELVENATATAASGGPSQYNIYSGILRAYILYQTDQYSDTLDVLISTQKKMTQGSNPSDERKYLENYISNMYLSALMRIPSRSAETIPDVFKRKHENINLKNVSTSIKKVFSVG
jgi:hypothetical protein